MKNPKLSNSSKPQTIDPATFGLSPRVVLEAVGPYRIRIVKWRKSHIAMKDGKQLLQQAQQIMNYRPDVSVEVATTAPVCSKTKAFLKERDISVIDLTV